MSNKNVLGGISHLTQQINRRRIHMLSILQALLKFVLRLGVIFGLAFMVACTVFVIYCIVHGDIKINLTKDRADKEKMKK